MPDRVNNPVKRAVPVLVVLGMVATPLEATDHNGPDSTIWTIATPWWCYKTSSRCEKLDVDGDVLDDRMPCTIEATGYYNDGNAANMCVNEG